MCLCCMAAQAAMPRVMVLVAQEPGAARTEGMRVAREMGVAVPASLRLRADRVIE